MSCRFVENFSLLIRYKKFSASATVFISLAFALYWALGYFGTAARLLLSAAKERKPFFIAPIRGVYVARGQTIIGN